MESAEPIRPGCRASVIGEGTGLMQPMDFPWSQRAIYRERRANESTEPLAGRLGPLSGGSMATEAVVPTVLAAADNAINSGLLNRL